MIRPFFLCAFASLGLCVSHAHDSFEITLEIQEKRKSTVAKLEMARSTGVAACDPTPSNGILFDPAEFPAWQQRFQAAAPDLIQILDTESALQLESATIGLNREDDIQIDYVFTPSSDPELRLSAPILNRFPPDGFGVRVTYRDKSGRWHPPFMLFVDQQDSPLPPQK
ncbi:hypothetical protein [Pelagicoccus sp. SDUM812005]|uniref:hypothetical protein n=1 Tax=Pelagicoccus sp. SDUM812005 TaxID=3041257 RepID=UPI00280F62D8|nr:hypothetical protein [Pelagicoccus sp. SDUM812005]MDQ8179025.1 hypothetical protein [Pelagicoccus sp. SDUM812005]